MMPDLRIQVVRVGAVAVPLPRYQTDGAAGMDLHAALADADDACPRSVACACRPGSCSRSRRSFEGQVRPRSGLAARTGLTVLNAPGTIDSDYRGEVAVLLVNLSDAPVTIEPLERIAQLVIAPVARAELVLSEAALDVTARGAGGYGSTGSR